MNLSHFSLHNITAMGTLIWWWKLVLISQFHRWVDVITRWTVLERVISGIKIKAVGAISTISLTFSSLLCYHSAHLNTVHSDVILDSFHITAPLSMASIGRDVTVMYFKYSFGFVKKAFQRCRKMALDILSIIYKTIDGQIKVFDILISKLKTFDCQRDIFN